MHHPAPVLATVLGRATPRRVTGSRPQSSSFRASTAIAALCTSEKVHSRLGGGDARLLGLEHRLVHLALGVGEPAGDRHGPGDVGGVEGVELDPGIHQQQVVCVEIAVVADPVQRAGVVAGGGDRVVADGVPDVPGVQAEDTLDPAFAATAADRVRELGDDLLERLRAPGAGLPHLLDLECVLDQPELGEGRPRSRDRAAWSDFARLLAADLVDGSSVIAGVGRRGRTRIVVASAFLPRSLSSSSIAAQRIPHSAAISSRVGRRPTQSSP